MKDSKFKKGDRVRLRGDESGAVGTIELLGPVSDTAFVRWSESKVTPHPLYDLVLVPEQKPEPQE